MEKKKSFSVAYMLLEGEEECITAYGLAWQGACRFFVSCFFVFVCSLINPYGVSVFMVRKDKKDMDANQCVGKSVVEYGPIYVEYRSI